MRAGEGEKREGWGKEEGERQEERRRERKCGSLKEMEAHEDNP